MRIQFCGADRTVTGSSHLIEVNGLRVFLDMGLYQGPREEATRLNSFLPADVRSADAIILSHAHLDHCGKLPVAVRAGFKGPIYCTPPTAEMAKVILDDAAKIQEEDANHLNRRMRGPQDPPIAPLFSMADVPQVLRLMKTVEYRRRTDLGNGVSFTFHDAGHILGSAYVILEWTEQEKTRRLLFTADVGRYGTPILHDPETIPAPVDLLISESTYGNNSHGPIAQVEPQLLQCLKEIIRTKSRLLIPAFAVGRTQSMLWYIQKFFCENQIPSIPVFVDSPMGVEATRVTDKFSGYFDQETTALIGGCGQIFSRQRVKMASTPDESRQINSQQGPCVIIASSPTCEFGRILHHLKRSIENPDDMIVFVGWTPPNTLGRRLQNGLPRVRIYDRWYTLRCQVRTIHGLSAHADGDELLRFLKPTIRKETEAYIVHGEVDQAEGFAQRLLEAGMGAASVPALESSVIAYSGVPMAKDREVRVADAE